MRANNKKSLTGLIFIGITTAFVACCTPSWATSAVEIDREVGNTLEKLYDTIPGALELSKTAKGILVFPSIVKAGFIFGGQYGEGALMKGSVTSGYYKSMAASWGLQAGIQSFSYVLFFMQESDLDYLDSSDGWEIGVGPTIVIFDMGMANSLTSTTSKKGVYAFIISQKGLMAGIGIQGSKITKIVR